MDTLREIGVNKICTLIGRCELKDLVDVFFLSKRGFTVRDHFAEARQKEGGLDKRIPRKAYYVIRDLWKNPKGSPKLKPPVNKNDEERPKVRGIKISGD